MDPWCSVLSAIAPIPQYILLRDSLILLLIVLSLLAIGVRARPANLSVTLPGTLHSNTPPATDRENREETLLSQD